jgi:hypothetical protein
VLVEKARIDESCLVEALSQLLAREGMDAEEPAPYAGRSAVPGEPPLSEHGSGEASPRHQDPMDLREASPLERVRA